MNLRAQQKHMPSNRRPQYGNEREERIPVALLQDCSHHPNDCSYHPNVARVQCKVWQRFNTQNEDFALLGPRPGVMVLTFRHLAGDGGGGGRHSALFNAGSDVPLSLVSVMLGLLASHARSSHPKRMACCAKSGVNQNRQLKCKKLEESS